jgi:Ribosomal protein L36e
MDEEQTKNDASPPSSLSPQTGREKRALKFTKRKLGTHKRGKAKRDEVADILRKKK